MTIAAIPVMPDYATLESLLERVTAMESIDVDLSADLRTAFQYDGPGPLTVRGILYLGTAIAFAEHVLPGWAWIVGSDAVEDFASVKPDFLHPLHGAALKAEFPDPELEKHFAALEYFNSHVTISPPGYPAKAVLMAVLQALISIAERRL